MQIKSISSRKPRSLKSLKHMQIHLFSILQTMQVIFWLNQRQFLKNVNFALTKTRTSIVLSKGQPIYQPTSTASSSISYSHQSQPISFVEEPLQNASPVYNTVTENPFVHSSPTFHTTGSFLKLDLNIIMYEILLIKIVDNNLNGM